METINGCDSNNTIEIDCEDVILRGYRVEDLDDLHNLTWQPHFYEFLTGWNVSREKREDWIKNYEIPDNRRFLHAISTDGAIGVLRLRLGIVSKGTGEFIGVCGTGILDKIIPPKREIFYGISENHRNKGYATQAVKGLVQYLFDHSNVEELVAIAQLRNIASNKVIQKCGFHFQNKIDIDNKQFNKYQISKK